MKQWFKDFLFWLVVAVFVMGCVGIAVGDYKVGLPCVTVCGVILYYPVVIKKQKEDSQKEELKQKEEK